MMILVIESLTQPFGMVMRIIVNLSQSCDFSFSVFKQLRKLKKEGYRAGHNYTTDFFLRGECFVFLGGIQITVILILPSKTRMCRKKNFGVGV